MNHIGKLHWHTHSQNLKKQEGGRGLNGRAWLHLYWGDPNKRGRNLTTLGIQWVLLRRQHSIGWSFSTGGGDSDRDVDFSIRIPYFGIYLGADDILPRRWMFYNPGQKYPSERTLGATWHDQALWVDLWRDPDEGYGRVGPTFWQDARSRARHIVIHPLDILFGRTKCTTEQLADEGAMVMLPEASYPVRVKIERRVWRRKRWPGIWQERTNATVESDGGIPIPGKGENGYDCEDDAYFSIGTPTQTAAEAAVYAAERVLETRQRYASRDWAPAP